MKKLLSIASIFLILFSTSCSLKNTDGDVDVTTTEVSVSSFTSEITEQTTEVIVETTETTSPVLPEESQIQYICQIATVRCYYHNVATATKQPGTGIAHFGEEATPFWFEYSATATFGIEAGNITMNIEGDQIYVHLPHATILDGNITVIPDSISEPVCRPNAWYRNDVEITAVDVTNAMSNANEKIYDQIVNDPYIISIADTQAQSLIRNYIDQIIALSGRNYEVHFIYDESEELPEDPGQGILQLG